MIFFFCWVLFCVFIFVCVAPSLPPELSKNLKKAYSSRYMFVLLVVGVLCCVDGQLRGCPVGRAEMV